MVTKLHKSSSPPSDQIPLSGSVKDSAQQIWQAGLGAFAKAQAEGTRAFEALVKEGTALQRKTQTAAEGRISDASDRMTHMATDIGSKASGHWDKLENIFEERVARAINKLGVPSAKNVTALITRIDELELSVQKLSGDTPTSSDKASTTRRKANTATKTATPTKARAATRTAVKTAPRTSGKTAVKAATKTPSRRPPKAAAKVATPTGKITQRPSAKRKPAGTLAAN